MSMQRRDFLMTVGAASALAALPGCATMGGGAGGKVVVVGGGYGGATAAKYIRMWSGGAVDVTLVEPNAEFVSCPMSNLVLGGSKDLAFLTTSYANLATGITADGHINLAALGIPLKTRPNLTGSTGATITCVMVARRPRRVVPGV
jgi:alanine dehydrogenase